MMIMINRNNKNVGNDDIAYASGHWSTRSRQEKH